MTQWIVENVPGAAALEQHFGAWPSFHDAEVLHLHLNRSGDSELLIHTWRMLSEVDENNYYKRDKFTNVRFTLSGIEDAELLGFDSLHGDILFALTVIQEGSHLKLELHPVLGLGGWIKCESISVDFEVSV